MVEGRSKRVGWIASLLATTAPFPAFLSVHAYVSLSLSFSLFSLSSPVMYLSSSNVWTFCFAGNVGYLAGYLVKRRVHTSRVKHTESDFQLDTKPGSARYPFHLFFIYLLDERNHCSLIQKLNYLTIKNTIFNLTKDEINRTHIFLLNPQSISASVPEFKIPFLFNLFILFIINLKDRSLNIKCSKKKSIIFPFNFMQK